MYRVALTNVSWSQSSIDRPFFNDISARNSFFESKGLKYMDLVNYNMGDNINPVLVLRPDENSHIFERLRYNYCIIQDKNNKDKIRFYFAHVQQDSNGQLICVLDLDDIVTNIHLILDTNTNIKRSMLLNEELGMDSKLNIPEGIKASKYHKSRERLELDYGNEDINKIINDTSWTYYFFKPNQYMKDKGFYHYKIKDTSLEQYVFAVPNNDRFRIKNGGVIRDWNETTFNEFLESESITITTDQLDNLDLPRVIKDTGIPGSTSQITINYKAFLINAKKSPYPPFSIDNIDKIEYNNVDNTIIIETDISTNYDKIRSFSNISNPINKSSQINLSNISRVLLSNILENSYEFTFTVRIGYQPTINPFYWDYKYFSFIMIVDSEDGQITFRNGNDTIVGINNNCRVENNKLIIESNDFGFLGVANIIFEYDNQVLNSGDFTFNIENNIVTSIKYKDIDISLITYKDMFKKYETRGDGVYLYDNFEGSEGGSFYGEKEFNVVRQNRYFNYKININPLYNKNTKLNSSEIIEYRIVNHVGEYIVIDFNKLNNKELKLLVYDELTPDYSSTYIIPYTDEESIYNMNRFNYNGLVSNNDTSIPMFIDAVSSYYAINKNDMVTQEIGRQYQYKIQEMEQRTNLQNLGIKSATSILGGAFAGGAGASVVGGSISGGSIVGGGTAAISALGNLGQTLNSQAMERRKLNISIAKNRIEERLSMDNLKYSPPQMSGTGNILFNETISGIQLNLDIYIVEKYVIDIVEQLFSNFGYNCGFIDKIRNHYNIGYLEADILFNDDEIIISNKEFDRIKNVISDGIYFKEVI